jgi:hypothetical protein
VTRRRLGGPLAGVLLCGLAGCSTLAPPAAAPASPLPVGSPSPVPAPSLPPLPSPTPAFRSPPPSGPPSFADGYAVSCAGYPAVSRILSVLRNQNVIGSSANMAASTGPLCAGGWQYTVLSETGHEPLQVVTQGAPGHLTLVTAGTDVCTPVVLTQAPPGILAVLHC